MINKQNIKEDFRRIRNNIAKAKTKPSLDYLYKRAEITRRKYINVYVNSVYDSSYKKLLEYEYNNTVNRIKNKIRRVS